MKLQEDRIETEDLKKRCTSIIIHGVKESESSEGKDRKGHDEEQLIELFHYRVY